MRQTRIAVANTTSKSVPEGTFLGTIRIPSIDKKVNIFQGTTEDVLNRGVGHFVHSVMPGVKDNSVLAGHRDTVFSNLGKVKVGVHSHYNSERNIHLQGSSPSDC